MSKNESLPGSPLSTKSVAVVGIVIARYLQSRDPLFADYLAASLQHARQAGLDPESLSLLDLLSKSIGAVQNKD